MSYRRLNIDGEESVPGESISFLEYLLGEERDSIQRSRPLKQRIKYFERSHEEDGLFNAILEHGIYYPLVSLIYRFF